ncbi:hypothetical protein BDR04DRAFT_1103137 [Suillus decipiens]|nr:hypothetical protein BDR04DRAFT_1103137 [Suillus decipiens]
MSWLGTLHVSNVLNGCYETFSNTGRSISGVSVFVRPNIFLHSTLTQGSRNHRRLLLCYFAAVFLLAFAMGFLASINRWESSIVRL